MSPKKVDGKESLGVRADPDLPSTRALQESAVFSHQPCRQAHALR